jgi:hypothetical protein
MKARNAQQKVFVVTEHWEPRKRESREPRKRESREPRKRESRPKGIPHIRILVAHAQDDRVVEVTEYIRR